VAALNPACAASALAEARRLPAAAGPPQAVAQDEDFWAEVGRAFSVDRSIVNLNNGGVSPSPASVQAAVAQRQAWCNSYPSALALLGALQPQVEAVRRQLAAAFGADPEELAITRNASEGLQTCQLGFELQPGDEVLTTTQDYPRMLTTFRQRERREGIALRQFPLPVPLDDPEQAVALFEQHIGPRTKLILMCHVINLTGQVLPVKSVVAMARRRGLPVIVDGAHALAHLDFRIDELDCDYYASSLHKWLFAPHGTGLLYVRREKIGGLWPLMAATEAQQQDIRKFEEIGTHPLGPMLGIAEALDFHAGLGPARKQARLLYLRDWWARRLLQLPQTRLRTSLSPGAASGIATVALEGVDTVRLQAWLWETQRILTTTIVHPEVDGLRVSPSVYTSLGELDRFCAAMERAAAGGLPPA
ncbi:MAG TPA: aminotransferase class V-fold PLP-dependent enzyme, partial [Planctomycetota bacterium]|nr:aminotransferase class V-fold PLP-dependent enzyme [Planctomycetota bacterium]